jgi:hypothetical protein
MRTPGEFVEDNVGKKRPLSFSAERLGRQVRPLAFASTRLRDVRDKRIDFHRVDKFLPVALNLQSRYFMPLNRENKVTVEYNRRVNPNLETFAHKYNQSTDFYGTFTRASARGALQGLGNIAKYYQSSVAPVHIGSLKLSIFDGYKNRFLKPIDIVQKTSLGTFIALGGT